MVVKKAEEFCLPVNDFVIRSALLKKIVVANGIDEVIRQQKKIGNNLNQLTRLAHEGRIYSVDLRELLEEHKLVTEMLGEILKEVK